MINENLHPNVDHQVNPNKTESKLATLLVIVVSFQEKV